MQERIVQGIPCTTLSTLIIGTGCAGYNAADTLYNLGDTDIAIVTEGVNMGTSRNTGSDKQTYYKLSTCGDARDSVADMAKSLFAGGSVHGDTALIEAASSLKCFMKLALLGVDFPTNEYGEYVGYKTDHDDFQRATSAGPLTSHYMTEVLQREVSKKQIPVFDRIMIFKLLVRDNKIFGAVGIDKARVSEKSLGLHIFLCPNVILATGGPASVYKRSVFPESQTGMSGMAFAAGAKSNNLQEWQYGLASTDFRWNVSGTYQQVIPRYISVDDAGNEYEFLYEALGTDSANLVFKKGYEWPFDSRKTEGSSKVDMLIYEETVLKKRRVYMDFTREPRVLENGFDALSEEAHSYLEKSGALCKTPIARLAAMNPKAIELYKAHGIDLYTEPLRVEVCAQHQNGGIAVDADWQTSIEGLYAAGEAAGTFGIYRPGGTALNSTQVGSMRCAEHIKRTVRPTLDTDAAAVVSDCLAYLLSHVAEKSCDTLGETMNMLREKFDASCGFMRNMTGMRTLAAELAASTDTLCVAPTQLCALLKLLDMIECMKHITAAMLFTAENAGTRGGSIVVTDEKIVPIPYADKVTVTYEKDGEICAVSEPVRPLPTSDTWFERVWRAHIRRNKHD